MKKFALMCMFFMMLSLALNAYPAPLWRIGHERSNPMDPVALHIVGMQTYIMDRAGNQVMLYDGEQAKLTKNFIKLGKSALVVDIFVHDKQIYLLDYKRSGVLVYDTKGKFLREFFTAGNASLRFKNPKRIVVNYQGFIYVLDDYGIRAFTMEGVPFGKLGIESPISMSLGEDQLLRVLRNSARGLVVDYLDQRLNNVSASMIKVLENRRARIADIAVNQWGEMHVINRDGINIGKLAPNGALLPNTIFGAFDTGNQIGVFQNPVYIKCGADKESSIIGILDSKQKAIHFFRDSEAFTGQVLRRPAYTMRPSMVESAFPASKDYLAANRKQYMISNIAKNPGAKPLPAVWAADEAGNPVFITQIKDFGTKKAKGLDVLAINQDKLYVLDTKAAMVHILNSSTGKYIESFAQRGNRSNNLLNPVDIAIGETGLIYIADSGHGRISVFNEHNVFINTITMPYPRQKPMMLKAIDGKLYYLTSDDTIFMIQPSRPNAPSMHIADKALSAFEIIYDGRFALLNGNTQTMKIVGSAGKEHELLAYDKNARFPFFENIHRLRYIPSERKLAILDRKAPKLRFLHFYAAPDRPDVISLALNDNLQAELSWERMPGIESWMVFRVSESDTTSFKVNEPRFTIPEPQPIIWNYQVCSIAADGKLGDLSLAVEDAYSYARNLSKNGNYNAAIYALYRSNKNIADPRIDEIIVLNHMLEAEFFQRSGQYEKALASLETASRVSGPSKEIGLRTVEIYKLMGQLRAGIDYLNRFGAQSNAEIMEQYIVLHHMLKDYTALLPQTRIYRQKFGLAERILRIEVDAYSATGQYALALSTLNELVDARPGFVDKLSIASLQIKLGNLSSANSFLQRMLTDHRNEKLDVVYALLGECNFQMGQYGNAADFYANAIRIDDKIARYHHGLAEANHFGRNREEALRNYQAAHRLEPDNPIFGIAYARALERENRFSDALSVLDTIAASSEEEDTTAEFHRFYSDLLTREGRYDEAYREILLVQGFYPNDDEVAEKVENALRAREFYNKHKAPVEIKDVIFDPIYPSLQEYYKKNPIGVVKLFNNRSMPITNIELKVFIPQIMDTESRVRIPSLIANENYVQQIIVNLNRRVFEYSRELNPRISITYSLDDSTYSFDYNTARIQILQDKAMNWSNRRQLAAFVNPADNIMRTFVSSVIMQSFDTNTHTDLNQNILKALQVYSFYRANSVRYNQDPSSANREDTQIDFVQYPFQTLNAKGGDCEDLVVLFAASLEAIGVETGFLDLPVHVIPVIDTKMSIDDILNSGLAVEHFINLHDTYWLPLESTVLSSADFITSWLSARKQYDETLGSGVFPEIFRFNEIHRQYPPAQFSSLIDANLYRETGKARAFFMEDKGRILQMSQISQEQEFLETLRRYPNNMTVKNQYARWSFSKGKTQQAERLWLEVLQREPTNFSAQVNLGNLYYIDNRFDLARTQFLAALKHNKDKDEIHRNLCLLEFKAENMEKALQYFRAIQNKDLVKNADFVIYSELLRKGD